MWLVRRARAFRAALRGLWVLSREAHCRIHAAASVVVIALGVGLSVSRFEWCVLGLAMGLVWLAEALNTALERLSDAAVPRRDPLVADAKDAAAAGVLLASLASAAVGASVFLPKLLK
jgi:diacylglycerol kinase (ATP)